MTRRILVLVALAGLLPLVAAPVFAQTTIGAPQEQIYRLTKSSGFQDGCFDPCLCPVQLRGGLIGTFRMVPAPPDPLYRVFDIQDLNWVVPEYGYWVTGSGTYKIGGEFALTQELSLALKVADRDVAHYESGLVPGGTDFPSITITISMNNMVCHDTVFQVAAMPVPLSEIQPYSLSGSSYEEGCFGPCLCVVVARPLDGRFGLVRIGGSDTTADFGVVGIKWLVGDPSATTTAGGTPVMGAGLYHVDQAAHDQRMRLALVENGVGPTRFDSGAVPWKGTLRRIDVDVPENGFACYDNVYAIHAKGRSAAAMLQMITPEPVNPGVTPTP